MAQFLSALSQSELTEGRARKVLIDDHEILLAKFHGVIYAFDALCTHETAELSFDDIKENSISCPLHGSEFDFKTGEVLCPPAERPLNTYRVKVENGEIMVEL
jgi:3-phenylpropionate/trans-cinnamate dioxygenase ferredoxin component